MTATLPAAEYVSFNDVQIGDRLRFQTRGSGFGGWITREGTVTSKTCKTITLEIGEGSPEFRVNRRGHGYTRRAGATARLRRADWTDRAVRRTRTATHVPLTPDNVVYREEPGAVYVFWAPDPAKHTTLSTAEIDDLLMDDDVVKVAEAVRYYRREGAGFSGWVISSNYGRAYSDPVPTKREMRAGLRDWAAEQIASQA